MADVNTSVYTEEEEEILNLTKKVRVDMVKHLVKDGMPDNPGFARVINEISGSLDTLINTNVANRIKHQDSANTKASAELVIAAIMSKKTTAPIPINRKTEIDDSIDVTVVPGQMEINPDKLNPSDFIESDEDE